MPISLDDDFLPPVTITNLAGNCVCSDEETEELLSAKGGLETLGGLKTRLKLKALHMERSWFDLIRVETDWKADQRHSPIQLDVEAFYPNIESTDGDGGFLLPERDAQREWNKLAIWFHGKSSMGWSLLSGCGKMKALTYDLRDAVTRHDRSFETPSRDDGFRGSRRGHGRHGLVAFCHGGPGTRICAALQMADDSLSRIIEYHDLKCFVTKDPVVGHTRIIQAAVPDLFAAHCEQRLHGDPIRLENYRKYSELACEGMDFAFTCHESLLFTATSTFREIADSRVERPSKKLCTDNSTRDRSVIEICITYMPVPWGSSIVLFEEVD